MSSQLPKKSAWAKGPPARASGAQSPPAQSSPSSRIIASAPARRVSNVPSTSIPSPASPSHRWSPPPHAQPEGVPIPAPQWGYYYYPGMPMDPKHTPPPPQGPLGAPTPGPSMPPTRQQPPLCPPGTQPQAATQELLGGGLSRLNSNADTFRPKRVTIKSESGQELDLERWKRQAPAPAASSTTSSFPEFRTVKVRLETEEARRARLAKEGVVVVEAPRAKKKAKKARQKAGKARRGEEAEEKAVTDEVERVPQQAEKKARAQASAAGADEGAEAELPGVKVHWQEPDPAVAEAMHKDQDTVSELKGPLWSAFASSKTKRRPAPLDLQVSKDWIDLEAAPSALAKARLIEDIGLIQYPDGVKRPKVNLSGNAAPGRFSYDRDFLLQFMSVCKDKPDALPPLDEIGIAVRSVAQTSNGRGPHGSRSSAGPPSYQPSVGFGISGLRKSSANPFTVTVSSGITPPPPRVKAGDLLSKFAKIL